MTMFRRINAVIGILTILIAFFGSMLLQTDAQQSRIFSPEITAEITATVEPIAPFKLIAPTNNAWFTENQKPTVFTWQQATNATRYRFVIQKTNIAADVLLSSTIDAATCVDDECSYTLTAADQDLLQSKPYTWKVIAQGDAPSLKAKNAPRNFQIIPQTAELLVNGGLEPGAASNRIPAGWTEKNTRIPKPDRMVCDETAYQGACAFVFKANADGSTSSISRQIKNTAILVNSSQLNFSAWVNRHSARPGTPFARVLIRYSDGTKDKLQLVIPESESGFVQAETTMTLDLTLRLIRDMRVELYYAGKGKPFAVDQVSLVANAPTLSGDDWLPLPPSR
jgi:hypothetical protein